MTASGEVFEAAIVDSLRFGDDAAESAHAFSGPLTQKGVGGLGQAMRQMLPATPLGPYGGDMVFMMKVDPKAQNYITVKLWGEDDSGPTGGRVILECQGYEVTERRHGVFIDQWGKATKERFWFRTVALPIHLTIGRSEVKIRLRSTGRISPYQALEYVTYQRFMDRPSRPVYSVWVHTDPAIEVPADEVVGADIKKAQFAVETRSTANILAEIKKSSDDGIDRALASSDLLSIGDIAGLADFYANGTQSRHYKEIALVDRFVKDMDQHVAKYYADNTYAGTDWGGSFQAVAAAMLDIWDALKSRMDQPINVGNGKIVSRREGWSSALLYGINNERPKRRTITNQILVANSGIYRANRALLLMAPSKAMTETAARRYIDEAAGLLPFSGGDLPDGTSAWPFGRNYFVINQKGTTREPGWVASDYGYMVPHLHEFWKLTGDVRFKEKALAMSRQHAMTHYFGDDGGTGVSGMRVADPIGVRNDYMPGRFRGLDFPFAVETQDPALLGYVQQQIEEGQFWSDFRLNKGDSRFPDQWDKFTGLQKTGIKLPFTPGQPDSAWADEDDHIVTLKHGDEFVAVNLFNRSSSIDGHVKVFTYSDSKGIRNADVVADDTAYTSSGRFLTGDAFVDDDRVRPPDNPVSAAYGVHTMLAQGENGDCPNDGACGGRPSASTFRFGHYLIGMNSSNSNNYQVKLPASFGSAVDMISGKLLTAPVILSPRSTVVLYLDQLPHGELPSRPLLVTATVGNKIVALSWNAVARASFFTLLRADSPGGPYTTVASNITQYSFIDRNVINGQQYYYSVVGFNASGSGGGSPDVAASPSDTGLPAPWAGLEWTERTHKGTASFDGTGTLTVKSEGYNLFGDGNKRMDDAFIVFQPWVGDGDLTARVVSVDAVTAASQSAIAIRGSLDSNAAGAAVYWTSKNTVAMGFRNIAGDRNGQSGASVNCSLPCWLKLTRSGFTISGFASQDGKVWNKVGEAAVTGLPDGVYFGPAASGNNTSRLSTSVFDSVSVTSQ